MQILRTMNNIRFGTQNTGIPTQKPKEELPKIKYTEAVMKALADNGEDEYITEEDKIWAEYMKSFNPDLFEHYD